MEANVLFSFSIAIIGFILIVIILYRQRPLSTKFLAAFLFTFTASNALIFLFESRYLIYVPFLFRIGPLFNYLCAPVLCFYFFFLINEKRQFKWWDLLHLIPATVYLIDFAPLYISSNEHKRQILEYMFRHEAQIVLLKEGWLIPSGTHYIFRHVIAIGYIAYLVYFLRRHSRLAKGRLLQVKELRNWVCFLIGTFLMYSVAGLLAFLFLPAYAWQATIWEAVALFSALGIMLLFKPFLLYGPYHTPGIVTNGDRPKQIVLSKDVSQHLENSLRDFIVQRQFLKQNIKIREVADQLKVQPYILSAYINHVYEKRFTDLINWLRIQYAKEGLVSGEWHMLTLEAIAEKAGFSNRTTFLTAFKKFEGMTPSTFLHKHKNGNLPQTDLADVEPE
jgi:AraC-like DNA-binding protein